MCVPPTPSHTTRVQGSYSYSTASNIYLSLTNSPGKEHSRRRGAQQGDIIKRSGQANEEAKEPEVLDSGGGLEHFSSRGCLFGSRGETSCSTCNGKSGDRLNIRLPSMRVLLDIRWATPIFREPSDRAPCWLAKAGRRTAPQSKQGQRLLSSLLLVSVHKTRRRGLLLYEY